MKSISLFNAIQRLDEGAEKYFDPNLSPSLNGFFIRTDADHNYVEHFNDNMNDSGQVWEHMAIRRVGGGNHDGPEISLIDTSGGGRKIYDVDSFRVNEGTDCTLRYREGLGNQSSQGNHLNAMSQDQAIRFINGILKRYSIG